MNKPMLFVLALAATSPAGAGEGKWTPRQVLELGPEWLRKEGGRIPLERLWDAKKDRGLLANAVNLGGCSASFISAEGLLISNHHCLVSILQEHSTPENNLLEKGFLARAKDQEKPGKAARAQVPRKFRDVTAEVRAAVPENADDLARQRAVEAAEKRLVAECEKQPATRCTFSVYDGGLSFAITEFFEITDLRLVYAPPMGVGEFGGEIDNWSWPRHTGDFAIARAYVAPDGTAARYDPKNVAYRPEFFFPVSTEGVKEGDFVAVLGYPGRTFRALLAEEMAERELRFYPRVERDLGEWIALIEAATMKSEHGRIAMADLLKSLKNRHKNAQGQRAGLVRGRLVDRQRELEQKIVAWARGKPDHGAALQARDELLGLHHEQEKTWDRAFLLDAASWGARALSLSLTLVRRSGEAVKPDPEREPGYQARDLARLRDGLEREQKRLFPAADVELFAWWITRAQTLPAEARLAAIDAGWAGLGEPAVKSRLAELYGKTKVLDLTERLKMFDETPEQLHARKDPLLELAFSIDRERRVLKETRDRLVGAGMRLRPVWRKAVLAHAGRPVAPDANGTLRVTFARVRGYAPRDGVLYTPQTTLGGLLAKHTGEAPFNAPDALVRTAREGHLGRWKEPALGDVPLCFLSDADTTGGNSGSPVIDARGRLVGVNFDRVWENVSNDFGYNPDVARNISVDARYLLWLLEQVEAATELLRELGVSENRPGAKGAGPKTSQR